MYQFEHQYVLLVVSIDAFFNGDSQDSDHAGNDSASGRAADHVEIFWDVRGASVEVIQVILQLVQEEERDDSLYSSSINAQNADPTSWNGIIVGNKKPVEVKLLDMVFSCM